MRTLRSAVRLAVVAAVLYSSSASAAERYAVVISGASGGEAYAQRYEIWRSSLVASLKDQFHYPENRLIVLAESDQPGIVKATSENVRRVFADLRTRVTKDDLLFVLLIGHGTFADDDAKFNLVGPDLSASQWAALLQPIPGRLVFVDTTGASFPFMKRLAAPGRIVLTATDSGAQHFDTVFPEFFVRAFHDPAADLDKNGRVSIWEAFSFASAGVRQWFEQRGQLPTERSLLDDTGDGIGREAQNPGPDGTFAGATYLEADSPASGADELTRRRDELEQRLDDLRLRKASSQNPERYDAEIESLLVEIARISRQIRSKP